MKNSQQKYANAVFKNIKVIILFSQENNDNETSTTDQHPKRAARYKVTYKNV